ncbi:DJ-1/PfpI family protein [Streptomyces sp. NPDC058576]|uniref:DJ-1/PfpI family protein n=1 Tax=Streptomyces sp. NPDC058576 TaxID=3346547 RepID=UPI00365F6690
MNDQVTAYTALVYLPEGFNALEAVGFTEAIGLVPGFTVLTVADKAGPVVSDSGTVVLTAQAGIDDIDNADILYIPGGRIVPSLKDERLLTWIRKVDAGTRFTTALCVGRALLGAAGLLHGVRVAAQPVPLPEQGAVEVPDRLVAHGKYVTGANAVSSLDVALHVAAQFTDAPTARAIQTALEYDVDVWGPPFPARPLPHPAPEELAVLMSLMSGGMRERILRELQSLSVS